MMSYGDQIAYETMLRLQLELNKFSIESRMSLELSVFTTLRRLCDERLDAQMSTVKAAAKRLRQGLSGSKPHEWNTSLRERQDEEVVMLAYLDEHPEDDDELVTVAWLEETSLNLLGSPRSGSTHYKTRGDVRRLCKALEIEVKEDSATRNALEKCRDRNEGAGNAC